MIDDVVQGPVGMVADEDLVALAVGAIVLPDRGRRGSALQQTQMVNYPSLSICPVTDMTLSSSTASWTFFERASSFCGMPIFSCEGGSTSL